MSESTSSAAPAGTLPLAPAGADRPLKVLLLTDYFPKPTLPAMGTWALTQAKALAAAGAQVRVVSPTSWIPPLLGNVGTARPFAHCPVSHDGYGVHVEYPRWFFYSVKPLDRFWRRMPMLACQPAWWTVRVALGRELKQNRPDVILAHHTVPGGVIAGRIKDAYGIPFVTQDADFGSVDAALSESGMRRALEYVAERAAARTAVAMRIVNPLKQISSASPAQLMYLGADALTPTVAEKPRPVERKGQIVIFCAAIFYTRKSIPLLVRAFAAVAAKHPKAILRIAGDGHERPAIESAIRETDVGDRVQLLGLLKHDQILQEMVWCDLFALIGHSEPMAIVYLEAMSAGKPILFCNDGGMNEVVTNGDNGVAIPPNDEKAAAAALDALLGDAAMRKRIGEAGRELFLRRLENAAAAKAALAILTAAAKGQSTIGL